MDFQQLLAKMVELDRPATESQIVDDCGMSPPMGPAEPPMSAAKPDTPPPSMSVNLNAQGMDNIESLMKLMTKVNPDMINQPKDGMPPLAGVGMTAMPSPTPMPGITGMGNLDSGPLKMLPKMDGDNDNMPGGDIDLPPDHDKDHAMVKSLDKDMDGDHDMDDHDMEKKKDKEEAFGNSLDDSEPDYKDIDAAVPNGNDLHKQKKSFSGKPYRGDNPMAAGAYESTDLRAQIRAELQQRLAEAKGAK
jgi:hypothetical protein